MTSNDMKRFTLNEILGLLAKVDDKLAVLDALDRDAGTSGCGDLNDQITTINDKSVAMVGATKRALGIVPTKTKRALGIVPTKTKTKSTNQNQNQIYRGDKIMVITKSDLESAVASLNKQAHSGQFELDWAFGGVKLVQQSKHGLLNVSNRGTKSEIYNQIVTARRTIEITLNNLADEAKK